ncbi:MAG: tetratricopeptide repeat protein [Nocardiopsaceae bacterium]|nr:tetratricopeptide repeat protein [Nocardiopsaceae bacterium]
MSAYANSYSGTAGTVIQAGNLGTLVLGEDTRRTVRLVPKVTSAFQDRDEAMAELGAWAEQAEAGGSRLWVITGEAGVGKTTLAVTWINENRHRFTHAQIAMECGGGPGEGRGRGMEEVCDHYFTQTRTLPGAAVTLTAKMNLLGSLIDGQPVAVLLDDPQSAAQVEPFLSNLPGVLVVVTSRIRLPGLAQHSPRVLGLSPLPDDAVRGMFEEIVGAERTRAEPEALDQLVRICAGLPLLASQAAGLLHDDTELGLAELVRRMTDQGRLAALDAGHDESMVGPSEVFEVVYRALSPPAARVYRAIGLHPARDFDQGLATALFAESPEGWTEGLEQLKRRGIIRSDRRGRYLMEDLTYEHARLAADRDDDASERRRIRGRIADYYLRGAIAASRCLQQRWTLSPLYDEEPPFPLPDFRAPADDRAPGDGTDPIAWTRENLPAIMACMRRAGRAWETAGPVPGYRWQMAEATNAYFTREGPSDERATILAWAEEDADACRDADAQARIQAQWGEMFLGHGELDKAEERFRRSLRAAESGSEYRGRGAGLEWLGITERRRGHAARALEYFDLAEPFLDPARPRSRALLQMHRADALALLGDPAALHAYLEAGGLFRQLAAEGERDHANEGKVLAGQAELLTDSDPRRAHALLEEALSLFQAADRPYQEAKAWELLGDLGDGAGTWQEALDLYERLRLQKDADRVRSKLSAKIHPEVSPDAAGGSQAQD